MKVIVTEQQLNKIYENIDESSCDCCSYFDFSTIFQQYNCVEKPLYFLIYKGLKCEITFMSPEDYIKEASESVGVGFATFMDGAFNELVDKYKTDMENGDKFPLPYYSIGGGGQEGRNRVTATRKLGCESIPVVKTQNLSPEEIKNWAEFFKDMSEEEIDQYFKDEFNLYGITGLGMKDLNSKIEKLSN